MKLQIILSLLLFASPALAQTPEVSLPPWTMRTCGTEQYGCYDQDGTRALLVFEENARHWKAELDSEIELNVNLNALVLNLEAQLAGEREITQMQGTRIAELNTQLEEEITQKNKYRAEADTVSVWPWVIGGSVGLLGVGIAIGALAGAF